MSVPLNPSLAGRDVRLTAVVSRAESEQIASSAAAAGLSVSSYLRERALGGAPRASEEATWHRLREMLLSKTEEARDQATAGQASREAVTAGLSVDESSPESFFPLGPSFGRAMTEQAFKAASNPEEEGACQQLDKLIARMEEDLDSAIASVKATIARIDNV